MHMPRFMFEGHHPFPYSLPMPLCENKMNFYLCPLGIHLLKQFLYLNLMGFTNGFFLMPCPLGMFESRYLANISVHYNICHESA